MNNNNYRVIFNKHRGMLMAVAENVASQGKSTGGQAGSTVTSSSPLMRLAYLGVAVAALFGGVTVVSAQIVADPNAGSRRPTVSTTASGIPLVNIVAPNATGLSHNQYNQFNVGSQGAILNNAQTITQTQTAGFVAGNPNLANGSARIILNEVTGTGRSQLNGYIEVAGQQAQVIVANGNGISCSGCGFINTSRGVLTTGAPVFGGDGSLSAFRVTGGDIQIGAGGLNANNMTQTDLIARSVAVNGQLQAQNLNVITGTNQVNYADLGVTVIQGDNNKPTVGIDVAQLGGMYANKIKLVGTEAGVGVVALGNIGAQAGDLNIDNMGVVTLNGSTNASGQIRIVGNDGVTNTGTLYGQQGAQIYSAGQIANSGTIAAQNDLTLFSGSIASTGVLGAGVNANGQATQAGNLNLVASGAIGATGTNTAGGNLWMHGASVNVRGAQSNAAGNVVLDALGGNIDQTASTLQAGGAATWTATGAIINDQGKINVSQLTSNSASLSNVGGTMTQSGTADTSITTTGAISNNGGTITTNAGNLLIKSGSLDNTGGQINHAGAGTATIQSGALTNAQGVIGTNGQLALTAASVNNQAGNLSSVGQTTAHIAGDISNTHGSIQSGGALTVTAVNLDNTAGSIKSLNSDGMSLSATGQLTNAAGGVIGGNGNTSITAGSLVNSSTISAVQNLGVSTTQALNNSAGTLAAGGAVNGSAGTTLTNNAGTISAGQVILNAHDLVNQAGLIAQKGTGTMTVGATNAIDNTHGTIEGNAGTLAIHSGTLTNDSGTISQAAAGALNISTGTFSNQAGKVATNGAATINAGATTNSGAIIAQQTLNLTAASLNNNNGTIGSNGALALNAGSQLTNSGGTIEAGTTASPSSATITASTLDNSAGTLGAGTIDLEAGTLVNATGKIIQNNSNGTATINVSQLLNNSNGIIGVTAKNLTLAPAALQNNGGSIAHMGTGTLTVQTGTLSNNGGVLGTNGAATITASSIANQGGKLSAVGNESVTSSSTIDNSQAGYIGGAAVTVNAMAGQINNQGGTIEGASTGATVNAQSLNNTGGKVQSLGAGAVNVSIAQALINDSGSISGKGAVTATANSISNVGGAMGALGDLTVTSATTLDNSNGSMEGMGNVATTAQGALTNVGGKIEALGSTGQLQVAGSTIDNTNGKIINVGTGLTTISGASGITNADPSGVTGAGLMGGAGDVIVTTPTLSNVQGGHIIAGGALNLNTTNSLDNTAGQLIATGALTLNQPGAVLTNVGGGISGGSVALTTASIDNTNGSIANPSGSGGGVAINTGTFTNTNGAVGSDVDLQLTTNSLIGDGKIVAGRDGNVSLQGDYTYDAGNQITANRNLTLSTTGTLTNTATMSAAGNITVNAANVINQAGADIASGNPGDLTTGTTTVNTGSGNLTNAGRIEGNNVNTTSNQVNNTGTLIGNAVTVNANTLTNDGAAAIIAGVNQVNLWVSGTVNNQNGATLYSLGDLNMAANGAKDANGYLFNQTGTINNLSSTIEADGTMNVAANQINNVRQNVQINTVTLSNTTTTMAPPTWWSSLRPLGAYGARFVNANTRIQDVYYVNPSQIVSTTPMVTPDGYLIYQVVVNLSPTDSAFEHMTGGVGQPSPSGVIGAQYGSQTRVTPTAGTQTLYLTSVGNNQTNPDQVAGSTAWPQYTTDQIQNVLGTISYSNQYGNCTTNCVRLQTEPNYTNPATTFLGYSMRSQADVPGGYPVEVQRIANQVVTATQLAATSGAPAKITSGGDMHLAIGTQLNNNNGQIAAGGNLTIDGTPSADGSNNTKIVNTSTQLTQTYTSTNQSGFGTADSLPSPPVQWTTWSNTPITLNTGVVGGTITSNQAVSITGGQINNTSVIASTRPIGASAASLGLGDGIAPLGLASNGAVGVATGNSNGVAGANPVTGGGSTGTPGAARVVDGARAGAVNTVLPTNGLYHVEPQANQPYLIQTDPRFTVYGNFISSDYMLNLLGINPAATEKRLGDGFYEQKLITDQVTNLTGKRYLNGYANNEDEYKALMTNGVQYAKEFNMVPGIALSDAQMAALTTDIVWLVNQTVTLPDGSQQTVLVPQVYLAKNLDLSPTGAVIAGSSTAIHATDITNTGGTISGTQQLLLAADHDISNIGGTLSGGNIGLFAGNNILDQSTTNTAITQFGNNSSVVTAVGAVGAIAATQNLVMSAGQNVNLQGAKVTAGGNAMVTAGSAINVETVSTGSQYVQSTAQGTTVMQNTHAVGSDIAAGGNLGVVSKGDTTITGSNLSSGKDMLVAAGGNMTIQNAVDSSSYHTDGHVGNATQVLDQHGQTAVGSSLSAGGNATVLAGAQQDAFGNVVLVKGAPAKDLTLTASTITAGTNADGLGNAALGATGSVTIGEAMLHSDFSKEDRNSSKGFLSSSSSHDMEAMSANVAQGSTVAGNQVSVTAGKDITVRGSNVVGLNDVALTAASGKVAIVSTQDTSETTSSHEQKKSGFTASFSAGVASVGYGKSSAASQDSVETVQQQGSSVASINGNTRIQAGDSLNVVASDISAGQNLTLIGKSVDLSAAQNTSVEHGAQQSSSSGFSVGVTYNPLAAFKSAYQQSASSNPSTSLLGKATKFGDAIGDGTLAANTPVVVQAGSHSASGNQDHATSTAQVSSLTAGNNLTVLATGGSITSQGASMSAVGDATLIAKDSINLDVAHSFETQGQGNTASGWSVDNRGSLPAGVMHGQGTGNGSTDTVHGTSLSAGGKATLATTDGDITLTAANLVANSDLSINAAKNLTIQSGQNTLTNANQSNNQAIGKVVISDTERFAGYSSDKSQDNNTAVTQVVSNVGSLQGNVNLTAGGAYTQTASNVLAKNDINITGQSININTANNTGNSAQSSSDLKVGAFATVTSPLIDLGNNLENAKKSDGRLQALQGLAAASNAYQAVSAENAAAGVGGSGELLKAEVGVGFTTANSQDRSNYSQAMGSTIQGGGNVNLTSTAGDIHATGAVIAAGNTPGSTLTLNSAQNILLDAGQSTTASSGSNHSAGVQIGVGYEVGARTGAYAFASANVGNGNYNNTATTNSNTHLSGDTVTLKSKGDTTLQGADVNANTINADVAGKLAITSVQDTSTQHNEQSNIGGRVQVAFGNAWDVSGSLSQSNANGSSQAVNQQSGLFAGNGGYHVTADSVALKGGAITSTNAANSDLTANSLSVQNITNQMNYSANTASISGGMSSDGQTSNGVPSPNVIPSIGVQDNGKATSTTYGTVTDGNITIGGQHMTSAAGLGAHTDLATANGAIAALPNLQNVMSNQQAIATAVNTITSTSLQIAGDRRQGAGQQATQAQGDVDTANTEIAQAQAVLDNPDSSDAQKAQAQQNLDLATQNLGSAQQAASDAQAALKNWGPTGDYTRALSIVTGLLTGSLAGQSVGQLAANASAPYAAEAIGNYFAQPGNANQTEQLLSHAVLGAVLAAANGTSAAAGAGAGASGELAAQVLTRELYPNAYDANGNFHPDQLSADQLNNVIALSTAVGALVSGTTGGSLAAASVGGSIAANAATYNRLLNHNEAQVIQQNARRFAIQLYGTDNPTQAQISTATSLLANTAENLVNNNVGYDVPYSAQAASFLQTLQSEYAAQHPDLSTGNGQYLFYATDAQKNQPWLNAGTGNSAVNSLIIKTPWTSADTTSTVSYSANNPYTPSNPCISAECIPVGNPGAGFDYISLQGNFYIASGGIAVNLHDGNMYGQWALGKSYPFGYKPGVTFTAGNIIGGADAYSTGQFLQGAGASAGGFYPFPPLPIVGVGGGVNHSYGGATSTEVGLSFPAGPGGGVSPVGYGFDLNKKKE
ncbi:Putative large exoprotein involved in heme utilization or adhesion of ShlA/HecA/FhaA family [Collimonas arenae]|uniref:Putative large exoprotein involved in heme utilization or adhesion of ShlA/HecA/FhaA family n=1 Tax=Collimonas arenae TaxID=279058 RepID=A0A0A1FEH7_9BURK|nr:hemagglutinin repeat-containing protein [Collimonas arenae]AIY42069.1 Putative large exoprotein involved in heme utilization or adhesion of ShlA/HecA/FhaA family [Collimonas arenae]